MPKIIHISRPPLDAGVVIAACCKAGYILENGKLTPDDFDFVDPRFPENATCRPCLDKRESYVTGLIGWKEAILK